MCSEKADVVQIDSFFYIQNIVLSKLYCRTNLILSHMGQVIMKHMINCDMIKAHWDYLGNIRNFHQSTMTTRSHFSVKHSSHIYLYFFSTFEDHQESEYLYL